MLNHDRVRETLTARIQPNCTSFKIEPLRGDASNRAYHRVRCSIKSRPVSFILMELAHAESFKKSEEKVTRMRFSVKELPFINIQRHLKTSGVAVPELLYYDREAGWIFLEDLGNSTVETKVKGRKNNVVRSYYTKAVDELIKIQTEAGRLRSKTCIAFGREMDENLLMWELDHFLEFGLPYCTGGSLKAGGLSRIRRHFKKLASELAALPKVFTHRDYHSRNLMVYKNKIWVLDFQDALMGPRYYDLASLLRDSYTVLDDTTVDWLLEYYESRTKEITRRMAVNASRRLFDFMSIQRNLKAVGRFVYIDKVKGNPGFLPYIPQTLGYVRKTLGRYPELGPLRRLLESYIGGNGLH
jgi:N-acetylmuramate 1-kinase